MTSPERYVSAVSPLETILITANPSLASYADAAGVSFVMVDLEIHGKAERQAAATTPIYRHTMKDVGAVRAALQHNAKLLVRVNPVHDQSKDEVEQVIALGADAIMLPYFRTAKEIETFRSIVKDRVKTIFLFETSQAAARADQVLDACKGQDVHFGLNDLMISLGTDSPFDAFAGGLIDWLSNLAQSKGLFYGIGGVGRIGSQDKVPAELILSEHSRLGSLRVILSRSFVGPNPNDPELEQIVATELTKIQKHMAACAERPLAQIESDHRSFINSVLTAEWKKRT